MEELAPRRRSLQALPTGALKNRASREASPNLRCSSASDRRTVSGAAEKESYIADTRPEEQSCLLPGQARPHPSHWWIRLPRAKGSPAVADILPKHLR